MRACLALTARRRRKAHRIHHAGDKIITPAPLPYYTRIIHPIEVSTHENGKTKSVNIPRKLKSRERARERKGTLKFVEIVFGSKELNREY